MPDDPELPELRAILAGTGTAAALGFFAHGAPLFLTSTVTKEAMLNAMGWAASSACCGVIAGAIGGTSTDSRRSACLGALVFVVSVGLLYLLGSITYRIEQEPFDEPIWLLAAACAVGALSGGMATVAARTVAKEGQQPRPFRFSLRELLVFCSLLSVVFAYAGHLTRR